MTRVPLIAVDLDRTLIREDSARWLWRKALGSPALFPRVLLRTRLRVLKVSSQEEFAGFLQGLLADRPVWVDELKSEILRQVRKDVVEEAVREAGEGGVIVLVTASAEVVANPVAVALGWECLASRGGGAAPFSYLFGRNKVSRIRGSFPPGQYDYRWAISDSPSDAEFLDLFSCRTGPGRLWETDHLEEYRSCSEPR